MNRHAPQGKRKVDQSHPNGLFPIVGIGASAGGLEAMICLLKNLPNDAGMALVLVQHLDPTHESALTTLLARATRMPVEEARHNTALKPNHLYIIPPNKMMVVSRRHLKLSPRLVTREVQTPIDQFFTSLAAEEGERAIGVILSGSGGSDGTRGLLAIKAAGGITFAQDQKTARYPGMPASVVAAGCVDFVLPPERITRELARIAGHPYVAAEPATPEVPAPAEQRAFEGVLAILRQRTAVDFAQYKHATLQRRIERRMVLHKLDSLDAYVDYLRGHGEEVKQLFNDILIHVTGFFRDPAVFSCLKRRLLARIIRDRAAGDAIRIWVPGCSTGEEAYSLAMVLTEFLEEKKLHCPVQIFGTDINESALEKARAGVYPEAIRADLSPERLRRFFAPAGAGYRVNKAVREMCIFARQNLASDPPFSNLDLVSCRNLLIYLGPALQRRVMPLFHYALRPWGYLLLGASETIGASADLFQLVDRKVKVYAKKPTRARPALSFGHPAAVLAPALAGPAALTVDVGPLLGEVQKQADRIVLTHHTPPGVIINRHMEVLQFRGRTGPYLEHAQGEASLSLLKMVREGLVVTLRTAVVRAMKQDVRVREAPVRFRANGDSRLVTIEVVPFQVPPSRERFFLVLFQGAEAAPATDGKKKGRAMSEQPSAGDGSELARIREELAATRESLEAIIEEHQATNEELRSANEEIMSSNEELETAKEELQSTNEELTTLNEELENRNSELEHVNNDLQNLLGSVNIPVIMVGADLRIRRFTAVAEKLLNLLPGDVGRPLTDINFAVNLPNLEKLVGEVIDTLQTRDVEAQDRNGLWWSVRIRPYKTIDNKINGVVIALVDIDVLKTSMEQVRRGRELALAVVDTVRRPLVVLDKDLMVQQANEAFFRAFQMAREDAINRRVYDLADRQWDRPAVRELLERAEGGTLREARVEFNLAAPAGRSMVRLTAARLVVRGGRPELILLSMEDGSEA